MRTVPEMMIMPSVTLALGVEALRWAVGALSSRMSLELGDVAPAGSVERMSTLADKLDTAREASAAERERLLSSTIEREDLEALDTWIRIAQGPTLHEDEAEVKARADVAAQLRAVRSLVSPYVEASSEEERRAE